jgi:hypothetical protein
LRTGVQVPPQTALLTMPVGGVVGKRQLFRPDGPLVSEIGFGAWCVVSPPSTLPSRHNSVFACTQWGMRTPRCAVFVETHMT